MRERITEEYLPQAIAIGIGVEMFWGMTARTLRPFILAEEIKFKKQNEFAYLVGRYTFDAISIVANNILRTKNEPAMGYMEKPYDFSETKEEAEERKRKAEEEKIKASFVRFAESIRSNMEKKDG